MASVFLEQELDHVGPCLWAVDDAGCGDVGGGLPHSLIDGVGKRGDVVGRSDQGIGIRSQALDQVKFGAQCEHRYSSMWRQFAKEIEHLPLGKFEMRSLGVEHV